MNNTIKCFFPFNHFKKKKAREREKNNDNNLLVNTVNFHVSYAETALVRV